MDISAKIENVRITTDWKPVILGLKWKFKNLQNDKKLIVACNARLNHGRVKIKLAYLSNLCGDITFWHWITPTALSGNALILIH